MCVEENFSLVSRYPKYGKEGNRCQKDKSIRRSSNNDKMVHNEKFI